MSPLASLIWFMLSPILARLGQVLWTIIVIMSDCSSLTVEFSEPARILGKSLRIWTRSATIRRMKMVLGDNFCQNENEWLTLWERHCEQVGRAVLESVQFSRTKRTGLQHQIALEGEIHLQAALQEKRGAVLLLFHFGSMGCYVAGLGAHNYPMTLAGNPMPLPYFEQKFRAMLATVDIRRTLIGDRLPQKAGALLQKNEIFASFIDFTVVRKHNVWLPLGRSEMQFNLAPVLIALRHQAPILCATTHRLPKARHRLVIHPPLKIPEGGTPQERAESLVRASIKLLEVDLKAHPEQWWPWDWSTFRTPGFASGQPSAI